MIAYFENELKNLKTLSPCEETNKVFTQLYNYCTESRKDFIKITPKVREINHICSNAEYQMELYYANQIIHSENPKEALANFIYFDNYKKLSALEYNNIILFQDKIQTMLFIWSGPLPLSAILYAQNYDIEITLMDISESALEISQKLILKLGLENKFHFISGDAQNIQTEKKYDVVIGASLIFENDFQQQILENIYKNISCNYFLVRSSNGIRQLMYKKVEKKFLNKYFQILLEIHPKNELVNSIIITKKYA